MRTVAVLTSTLAVGVVLLLAAPAAADHDLTCHPPGSGQGWGGWEVSLLPQLESPGTGLGFLVDPEGAVRPFGAVHLAGIFLPQAAGASAQCADANGNGVAGLTRVTIPLQAARTGERAVATVTPDEEIDASGLYGGTIEICGARGCTRAEVELRAQVPARSS